MERTSINIKCDKGIFLPTMWISSLLACEPVEVASERNVATLADGRLIKDKER